MTLFTRSNQVGLPCVLVLILLIFAGVACTRVEYVRFSSETFPPKKPGQVEVLGKDPTVPFTKIAQLSVIESTKKLTNIQPMIMKKAASMGADAVIFKDPEVDYEHRVSYAPVYRPWGYYTPHYGWYGGGYTGAMPVSHKIRRHTLTGLAVRYKSDTKK